MAFVIGCLVVAAAVLQPSKTDTRGSIAMLNIGQGDSFLITSPTGSQLLIDGGKDATVLSELARVMPAGDRSIDVVIGTHPDADHIGGLAKVLDRYDVGLFLTSGVSGDTDLYKNLLQDVIAKHIPAYFVRKGMTVALDASTSFKILFPDRDTTNWETNTASVVGRLQIGNRSALFTGDSPVSIEHYLATTDPKDINVDILKLGHHGSKTSSSEEYLKATSPTLALISAGVNNRYGHPNKEVIDRLKALKIPFVSTQDKGTVVLSADGEKWTERDLN
jgi:competence protein ComEC